VNNSVLWLWLCAKVKREKQILLLESFKSIENIYSASLSDYTELEFLKPDEINLLVNKDLSDAKAEYHRLSDYGIYTLTIDEPGYPEVLKHIFSPPALLYCKGKFVDMNKYLCLAMVGTRKATAYGKSCATNLAKELARRGVVVVSGMAAGIDTYSHEGALKAGAPTVAIVGCGLDTVYPPSNKNLMERIAKTGMIISEYPIGSKPERYHFPERNRIIAGSTQGTIVVEADIKSGSLITVKYAAESGREIFSVPGNINSVYSRGANALIRDGAKPALSAEEILYSFEFDYKDRLLGNLRHEEPVFSEVTEAKLPLTEGLNPEEKILEALKGGPANADKICEITNLDIGSVNSALLLMELKGLVIKGAGGFYELMSSF